MSDPHANDPGIFDISEEELRAAVDERSVTEPVTCGTTALAATDGFRPDQIGCGQPVDEVYRCVQCGTPFHRDCARRHFDWPMAGGGPMPHALDAVLADADAATFIANSQASQLLAAERERNAAVARRDAFFNFTEELVLALHGLHSAIYVEACEVERCREWVKLRSAGAPTADEVLGILSPSTDSAESEGGE